MDPFVLPQERAHKSEARGERKSPGPASAQCRASHTCHNGLPDRRITDPSPNSFCMSLKQRLEELRHPAHSPNAHSLPLSYHFHDVYSKMASSMLLHNPQKLRNVYKFQDTYFEIMLNYQHFTHSVLKSYVCFNESFFILLGSTHTNAQYLRTNFIFT